MRENERERQKKRRAERVRQEKRERERQTDRQTNRDGERGIRPETEIKMKDRKKGRTERGREAKTETG